MSKRLVPMNTGSVSPQDDTEIIDRDADSITINIVHRRFPRWDIEMQLACLEAALRPRLGKDTASHAG